MGRPAPGRPDRGPARPKFTISGPRSARIAPNRSRKCVFLRPGPSASLRKAFCLPGPGLRGVSAIFKHGCAIFRGRSCDFGVPRGPRRDGTALGGPHVPFRRVSEQKTAENGPDKTFPSVKITPGGKTSLVKFHGSTRYIPREKPRDNGHLLVSSHDSDYSLGDGAFSHSFLVG